MKRVSYQKLDQVDERELLEILNHDQVREHLVEHDVFTLQTLRSWVQSKTEMDLQPGCRVRAVMIDDQLVGWCGIQPLQNSFELAIIIDSRSWGAGKQVFKDLISWSKDFGHNTVYINLLETRREYRFLHKMSKSVKTYSMIDREFTCYEIAIS